MYICEIPCLIMQECNSSNNFFYPWVVVELQTICYINDTLMIRKKSSMSFIAESWGLVN